MIGVTHSGLHDWSGLEQSISKVRQSKSSSDLPNSLFPHRCLSKQAVKMELITKADPDFGAKWTRYGHFKVVTDWPVKCECLYVLLFRHHCITVYTSILHAYIILTLVDAIFKNTVWCLIHFIMFYTLYTHYCVVLCLFVIFHVIWFNRVFIRLQIILQQLQTHNCDHYQHPYLPWLSR